MIPAMVYPCLVRHPLSALLLRGVCMAAADMCYTLAMPSPHIYMRALQHPPLPQGRWAPCLTAARVLGDRRHR